MTAPPPVELLLATYNSERYLADLLESLVSQTHDDFALVVSDDGSSDTTLEIIAAFTGRFRHPVRMIEAPRPAGSAMRNFSRLLENSTADYVMLVDHDDIWHPEKVECGLELVRSTERRMGSDHRILAHGDLRVINGQGEPTTPSFWAMKQIDPDCSQNFRRTLIHASVVGCTATMNRALVKAVTPVPGKAVMHDWWISLIAVATGTVVFDRTPRIDYRIHGNNVSNPREASATRALGETNYRAVMKRKLSVRADQAHALAQLLESEDSAAAVIARRFANLPQQGFLQRRVSIVRNRFLFPGIWRNLAMAIAA